MMVVILAPSRRQPAGRLQTSAFGMVLQDPFLYSKTVKENVVIGRKSAADHEIEESARAADVHGNIVEFEEGYDTRVGERGVTLSGGQRQRIAIARSLLMNPTFFVLDDSLSATLGLNR